MKKLKCLGAVLVLAAILARPEAAVAGAQRAMRLWYSSVAPALFPFLVLMPLLTGPEACAAYNRLFSGLMKPVFRLPGAAAGALVIGMISGSPGGAMAVRRIAAANNMRASQAERLALVMGGVSPAYLVMGVGFGLYGSIALGIRLAVVQVCVQLLLLACMRQMKGGDRKIAPVPERPERSPVPAAVEQVLAICGYMVIFGSVASVAAEFLGERLGTLLLLAADLPTGLAALSKWNVPGKFLLQGAAIGFGGLCIAAQNLDVLAEVGVRKARYFAARLAAAVLCALGSVFVLYGRNASAVISLGQPGKVYALSLLAASAAAIPVLFFFSKKLFLNK